MINSRNIRCAYMRNISRMAVEELREKENLGDHRFRCENNIKMYLSKIVCEGLDYVAEDAAHRCALVCMVKNPLFPQQTGCFLTS
jgi:hypothetical protein